MSNEGIENLFDYIADAVERNPALADAPLGTVMAEAFVLMSQVMHPPDERVENRTRRRPQAMTPELAVKLVKQAGSLRAASTLSGYTKSSIQRALVRARAAL